MQCESTARLPWKSWAREILRSTYWEIMFTRRVAKTIHHRLHEECARVVRHFGDHQSGDRKKPPRPTTNGSRDSSESDGWEAYDCWWPTPSLNWTSPSLSSSEGRKWADGRHRSTLDFVCLQVALPTESYSCMLLPQLISFPNKQVWWRTIHQKPKIELPSSLFMEGARPRLKATRLVSPSSLLASFLLALVRWGESWRKQHLLEGSISHFYLCPFLIHPVSTFHMGSLVSGKRTGGRILQSSWRPAYPIRIIVLP